MNLRELAEADLAATLTAGGDFGQDVEITNPSGDWAIVKGQTGDISRIIDPETGQQIVGRVAHAAVRISDLAAVGMPVAVQDPNKKPWTAKYTGLDGVEIFARVVEAFPDRTLGLVVLLLERYSQVPT